jgi:uncharacterized Zn-finger protein
LINCGRLIPRVRRVLSRICALNLSRAFGAMRHSLPSFEMLNPRNFRSSGRAIAHFHNDLGVQVIEIGAKKFMCMGALPPQDHPHVFCDMGEDRAILTPRRMVTAM